MDANRKYDSLIRQIQVRQLELMGSASITRLAKASGIGYDRMRRIIKDPGHMKVSELAAILSALHMGFTCTTGKGVL